MLDAKETGAKVDWVEMVTPIVGQWSLELRKAVFTHKQTKDYNSIPHRDPNRGAVVTVMLM